MSARRRWWTMRSSAGARTSATSCRTSRAAEGLDRLPSEVATTGSGRTPAGSDRGLPGARLAARSRSSCTEPRPLAGARSFALEARARCHGRRMANAASTPTRASVSYDPATGEVVGTVPCTAPPRSTRRSRGGIAATSWSQLSFAARGEELIAFRKALAAHADESPSCSTARTASAPRGVHEVMMALGHLQHAVARAEIALEAQARVRGMLGRTSARDQLSPAGRDWRDRSVNYPLFTPMARSRTRSPPETRSCSSERVDPLLAVRSPRCGKDLRASRLLRS